MIYFLRSRLCKSIKVGWTAGFTDRISKLRRSNFATDIEVLGTIDGDQEKEKEILERLSPYLIHHEFFSDRQEVLDIVNNFLKDKFN